MAGIRKQPFYSTLHHTFSRLEPTLEFKMQIQLIIVTLTSLFLVTNAKCFSSGPACNRTCSACKPHVVAQNGYMVTEFCCWGWVSAVNFDLWKLLRLMWSRYENENGWWTGGAFFATWSVGVDKLPAYLADFMKHWLRRSFEISWAVNVLVSYEVYMPRN